MGDPGRWRLPCWRIRGLLTGRGRDEGILLCQPLPAPWAGAGRGGEPQPLLDQGKLRRGIGNPHLCCCLRLVCVCVCTRALGEAQGGAHMVLLGVYCQGDWSVCVGLWPLPGRWLCFAMTGALLPFPPQRSPPSPWVHQCPNGLSDTGENLCALCPHCCR